MGRHRKKNKTGHLSLSRGEKHLLDTAVHEAAHAVIGIALGLKLGDPGVVVLDPSYPTDRLKMRMFGASGYISLDPRFMEKLRKDKG